MLETLSRIKDPKDIKEFNLDEMQDLAKDIRHFLVHSLSKTGGHLASNLGVVELTLAMHYVFDSPKDKFVFDVGHQAYVHKLLTGRRKGFKNLRQYGGMSGFPKRYESEHDVFETGHSSTSISAALGLAVARDLKGEKSHVLAVIGDGALTGGMAYEALNNAGRGHHNLIVVLNDNEMSISENVGGMGKHLNHIRSRKEYARAKEDVQGLLGSIPVVGDTLVKTAKRTKEGVKTFLMENTIFEEMGFTYLGPIDGHNQEELIHILENAKGLQGPILIHVKTQKGRGYKKAEQFPSVYHGVGPFDIKEGVTPKGGAGTFSKAFGDAVMTLAKEDETIVAITAAMGEGTGLGDYEKAYPSRFFDVGIAEQHAVTFAAGLASNGYRPVVAIYSSFLQRAYDQIVHDVALQNLPVIFGIDRAGLVGEDGSTHQGVFDMSFLSHIPNMTILCVKAPEELEGALRYARSLGTPVAIRYPRGGTVVPPKYQLDYRDVSPKLLEEGGKVCLVATGKSVVWALAVHEALLEQGIEISVLELPKVCPLPEDTLVKIGKGFDTFVTLEDHVLIGGMGMQVAAALKKHNSPVNIQHFAYKTGVVEHGNIEALLEREGMTLEAIKEKVLTLVEKEA